MRENKGQTGVISESDLMRLARRLFDEMERLAPSFDGVEAWEATDDLEKQVYILALEKVLVEIGVVVRRNADNDVVNWGS